MKWFDKIVNALNGAKNIMVGTILKVTHQTPEQATKAVDELTDKLEAPLSQFIRTHFPELPSAIAASAAKAALDHVDAAVAGLLAAKK